MAEKTAATTPKIRPMQIGWNGMMIPEPAPPRLMEGVTPAMMRWWSMHRNTERYKAVHPDHILFKTVYMPPKGDVGARFYHEEKHGRFMEKTTFMVEGASENSFDIVIKTRGFTRRTHLVFMPAPGGTLMSSTGMVGSLNPIWGRFWNFITRKFIFTPEYQAAVAEHSKLEFTNTPRLLPKMYAEAADK